MTENVTGPLSCVVPTGAQYTSYVVLAVTLKCVSPLDSLKSLLMPTGSHRSGPNDAVATTEPPTGAKR